MFIKPCTVIGSIHIVLGSTFLFDFQSTLHLLLSNPFARQWRSKTAREDHGVGRGDRLSAFKEESVSFVPTGGHCLLSLFISSFIFNMLWFALESLRSNLDQDKKKSSRKRSNTISKRKVVISLQDPGRNKSTHTQDYQKISFFGDVWEERLLRNSVVHRQDFQSFLHFFKNIPFVIIQIPSFLEIVIVRVPRSPLPRGWT